MDHFQRDVITIILAALTNSANPVSPDFDLDKGAAVARKHNIAALFYYGALACGVASDAPTMKALFGDVYKALFINEQQLYEIAKIKDRFEEEGIRFLPLKGTVLKGIYPKPEMRSMGDADILIDLEQYPQIQKILAELGFAFKCETDHELVWVKRTLFLELHKSVMTSYNKDFYRYFNTGWDFARKKAENSTEYELKSEDFFIYLFVHFTKHYRISGIGIKHIIDLWVYKNAQPDMDEEYIAAELKKLQLVDFYDNVMKTLGVWFGGEAEDEKTDLITNLIFSSGQYGTEEMSVINRVLRESKNTGSVKSAKRKKVWDALFLPYKSMCDKYPVLQKAPILLPLMWLVRMASIALFQRKKIAKYKENLAQINLTSLNEHQQALNFVGLDFNFKEQDI